VGFRKKLKAILFKSKSRVLLVKGEVISVKDGVAKVNGLKGVISGEMVKLGK